MDKENGNGNGNRVPQARCNTTNVDLLVLAVAFVITTAGGYVLESVILIASATHYLAGIGFRMLIRERCQETAMTASRAFRFAAVQVMIWTCCLLLMLCVAAMGAHGVFHTEPLALRHLGAYAAPGVAAALATAAYIRQSRQAGLNHAALDAWLAATPSAIAFGVAFWAPHAQAGVFDAVAGLVVVLLLCVRALMHLGRAFN